MTSVSSNGAADKTMSEDDIKKTDEDDDVKDDSTEVLLSHETKNKHTSSSTLCFPDWQTFLKSYRSSDPQSRVTPFAVVLLLVISIVYVLNQADRLVLAVLIPSGLQCINGGPNGSNDSCVTEDHNSQIDNDVNNSDCISFNNAEQGLLTGPAFTVVYVVAGLPLAWLADTKSRPIVFLGGIGFWSVMVILMGFIHEFWELLLLRIMLGVGEVRIMCVIAISYTYTHTIMTFCIKSLIFNNNTYVLYLSIIISSQNMYLYMLLKV